MAMDEGLEGQLRALLDKQVIWEVMLRYCRGIDHRDHDLVRSTYHPDAYDDHGSFVGGIDDLIAENSKMADGWVARTSTHSVGTCLIDLDGAIAHFEPYFVVHKPVAINDV